MMKREEKKKPYEAPKVVFLPLDKGQSVLVTFSLEWGTDGIAEDDNEW